MNIFSRLSEFLKRKIVSNYIQPFLNKRRVPGDWTYLNDYQRFSLNKEHTELTITCKNGKITVRPLTPSIWRILINGDKSSTAQADMFPDCQYLSWSVILKQAARLDITQASNKLHMKNKQKGKNKPELHAVLDTQTLGFEFRYGDRVLHTDIHPPSHNRDWIGCTKKTLEKEFYCGFGEKMGGLFKNNSRLIMWNTDNSDVKISSDPIWQSFPLQIAVREDGFAHAIFYDNPHYCQFTLRTKHNTSQTSYAAQSGPLCYYVISGPQLKDVLSHFTKVCGRYPLPPRWVLGHHHSRWEAEESAERLLHIADEFRKRKLPCDALHIDIGHMDGYRSFTWNRNRFPQPARTIKQLHAKQFKTVIMSDPGLKKDPQWDIYKQGVKNGYFCTYEDGTPFHAPVWPGDAAFPDYTSPHVRSWWGSLYSIYTKLGLDAYWIDMNEPSLFTPRRTMPDHILHNSDKKQPALLHKTVHNCYGMLMAQATYRGLCALRKGLRTFLFTRSGCVGIQRYAASWTADNKSSWSHLRVSIPMLLNMGLSGQVIVGPDIGGFWGKPSRELFLRWMQLGAFYPFSRNHTCHGTPPQEIWHFGEKIERIARDVLRLRYTLLPYFYTYVQQACTTGIPLMRPLFIEFAQDPNCYKEEVAATEFLIGPDLLVAPILKPKKTERKVYLPQDNDWIDLYTHAVYAGGANIKIPAPLEKIPVFFRRGSVIATSQPVAVSEEIDNHSPVLLVFPHSSIKGSWYIDDGFSLKYEQGHYSLFTIKGKSEKNTLTLLIEKTAGNLSPALHPYSELIIKICLSTIPAPIKTILSGRGKLSQNTWKIHNSWCEIKLTKPVIPLSLTVHY